MIIGTSSCFAAWARTRSPRYADNAQMPIGAIPNGADQVLPNSVLSVERFEVSTDQYEFVTRVLALQSRARPEQVDTDRVLQRRLLEPSPA